MSLLKILAKLAAQQNTSDVKIIDVKTSGVKSSDVKDVKSDQPTESFVIIACTCMHSSGVGNVPDLD
eukprot:1376955-Amorphochlora_amoeboformis.AAC.2